MWSRKFLMASLWQRCALGGVLVLSAFLSFFRLDQIGYGNTYYAAAVKSMLLNWHNFFFVSFDPGGFVTIDKPPLGFWIQAASARLFGFSGLSLLLPEALAGVLSVALLYRLVARVFGPAAGLLAALALALTPISVVTNRNNTIDSLLVLTVLLAAWAVSLAAETGRLRWLLLGALLVGLGFNIKMLEAYLVVPALGVLYLLGSPVRWWRRMLHLALAVLILLVVSLSWILVVDLTPASQRPYVGSSSTNSELELALGYNGLARLLGLGSLHPPQPVHSRPHEPRSSIPDQFYAVQQPSVAPPREEPVVIIGRGAPGLLRLFSPQLGGQTSWLLPLALLGMLALSWRTRPRVPLDKRWQALVFWGVWLLTTSAFFSIAQFFNTYYLVMLAPALCALFGIGLVTMWQDYRSPGWRGWLLPAALFCTVVVQATLLSPFPYWSSLLTPFIICLCLFSAGALALVRLFHLPIFESGRVKPTPLSSSGILIGPRKRSIFLFVTSIFINVSVIIGVLALLITPIAWSGFSVLVHGDTLQNTAGPGQYDRFPAPIVQRRAPVTSPSILERYLLTHRGEAHFVVVTLNTSLASPIILETGEPVMALGGFRGTDPILTLPRLIDLVRNGVVRFFLLPPAQARSNAVVRWVSMHCTVVSSKQLRSVAANANGDTGVSKGLGLFDCGG